MPFLLYFLQNVRSRFSGYQRLKNCLEESDNKKKQEREKEKIMSGSQFFEADFEREAIYCAQHSSRRRGLGETEMQEDIGTIREEIFKEALRDGGLL